MITVPIRSITLFAAGVAVTLLCAVVFVGVRAGADPGPDESTFVPATPCRLFDTRPAPDTVGPKSSPLGAMDTHTQQVHGTNGDCTIPSHAVGVAMNVTVTDPTAPSFLTIYPNGAALPTASSLNYLAGQPPTPNKVDVKLSPDGRVDLYNLAGTANVFADVVGYYTTSGLSDLQGQIDGLQAQITAGRVHTDVYSGRALQYRGGTAGGLNGCEWSAGTTSNQYLPLALPLGSTILNVEARVLDSLSTSYEVAMIRESPAAAPERYETTVLKSATGGALAFEFVDHDLTPSAEVVDDGETFSIRFDPNFGPSASGNDNELCRVEVTYRE